MRHAALVIAETRPSKATQEMALELLGLHFRKTEGYQWSINRKLRVEAIYYSGFYDVPDLVVGS